MRVGQARKRDANERAIVDALGRVGAAVFPISAKGAPDLLVYYRGRFYAAEIKTRAGKLTAAQEHRGAGTFWPIWRTVDDALKSIGAMR